MEQVPKTTNTELSEYLTRQFTNVDFRLNNLGALPISKILPTKPVVGKLYYFSAAIPSSTITAEGVWVYKSSGWAFLG